MQLLSLGRSLGSRQHFDIQLEKTKAGRSGLIAGDILHLPCVMLLVANSRFPSRLQATWIWCDKERSLSVTSWLWSFTAVYRLIVLL